jgi:hypothetical protein
MHDDQFIHERVFFLVCLLPLFLIVGPLIIKDALHLISGKKYPPPFYKWYQDNFPQTRRRIIFPNELLDDPVIHKKWKRGEGIRSLVFGLAIIVFSIIGFFYYLK